MATQFPPKKNAAFTMYVSLISQANTKVMQSNPTLAAGDVKVSIDGGALANLTTLPAVTPASSKLVKVDLSSSEMNGDNIAIIFSDAAGSEWCDLVINLQTTARQIDDLAYPTVSGRSLDVTATGGAGIDWGNVENPTTVVGLSGTTVKTATDVETDTADIQARLPAALVSGRIDSSVGAMAANTLTATAIATDAITAAKIAADAIGASELAADAVAEIQSGLSTLDAAGVRTAVGLASANLDTQLTTIDDFLDTEVAAIKAKTDNLPASPAAVGSAMTLSNAGIDAIFDRTDAIETGYTLRQALRIIAAALAGELSGAATATITIRNIADTKTRITATVDADGNRSALTLDAT